MGRRLMTIAMAIANLIFFTGLNWTEVQPYNIFRAYGSFL